MFSYRYSSSSSLLLDLNVLILVICDTCVYASQITQFKSYDIIHVYTFGGYVIVDIILIVRAQNISCASVKESIRISMSKTPFVIPALFTNFE